MSSWLGASAGARGSWLLLDIRAAKGGRTDSGSGGEGALGEAQPPEAREDVVDGVVEIGDRQRGAEAQVRLRPSPQLRDPAGRAHAEHGLDVVAVEHRAALVAGADDRELHAGHVTAG